MTKPQKGEPRVHLRATSPHRLKGEDEDHKLPIKAGTPGELTSILDEDLADKDPPIPAEQLLRRRKH
jgi:hypothetical protein